MTQPSVDRRTEALIKLSETLATERLEVWDRRLRQIDQMLRGGEDGKEGLLHTVGDLVKITTKHDLLLFGQRGNNGIVSAIATNTEFVASAKAGLKWLLGLLVLNFLTLGAFLFKFVWTQVTGIG